MTDLEPSALPLGSDRPVIDPAEDAFGYAPFARRLARAVAETPSPQGLVMAIHGRWGCGKSTLLNFVKHEIAALTENRRPIVIDFNPWWFEGQQNLAAQFLAQFTARLPRDSEALLQIGDVIAKYADAIGSIVAASTGSPLVAKFSFVLKLFERKTEDVPTLKAKIANALRDSGQRFLFILDDIDRLTPDEVREVFKVVKALADFPNVFYILAFDRTTVVDALEAAHKIDGEAYLEKIVQAPFSLPAIDRVRLRKRLQEELGRLIDRFEGPSVERTHWANVYMDGLDPFLTKPRDIVRVMNALKITYPAVAGEVNTVDFIAMEFLRLFEPAVYGTVRDHPDRFTGHSNDPYDGRRDSGKEFHEAWLAQVSLERREQLRALMKRLFPRLQSVWGNMGYDARHEVIWRNALRVCSADIFAVYFQFGIADDVLSRRELNELLTAARAGKDKVIEILTAAGAAKRPTGTSKARDYLERIRDFEDEITPQMADVLATALSDIGEGLLAPEDEQAQGIGSLPNRWRLLGVINYLLKRAEPDRRLELIKDLVAKGRSIALAADAIETVDELRAKPDNAADWALAEVGDELLAELKQTWVERMRSLSQAELLATPELDFDLHRWMRWGDPEEVVERIRPLFESDELLPRILEKHLRFGTRHVNGDRISNRIPILNPKTFEQLTDIYALEPRVQAMLERENLTENQRIAGKQYLWAIGRIRQGKDPGSMRDID